MGFWGGDGGSSHIKKNFNSPQINLTWLAFVMMKITSTTTVMADYCLVALWGGEDDDYSHSDDSSLVGLWGGRVHLCSLFHRDLSHRIDPPLLSRIADLHSLQIIIGQYEFA